LGLAEERSGIAGALLQRRATAIELYPEQRAQARLRGSDLAAHKVDSVDQPAILDVTILGDQPPTVARLPAGETGADDPRHVAVDSHLQSGAAFHGQNDAGQALRSYRQALSVQQRLVEESGDVNERSRLALTHHNLATTLWQLERRDESLESFQQAIEHQVAVLNQVADPTPYLRLLVAHFSGLASICGQWKGPTRGAATALAHTRWPDDPMCLYAIARTLARRQATWAFEEPSPSESPR
jgi:tetratricopeptide (TPR) repeat protein